MQQDVVRVYEWFLILFKMLEIIEHLIWSTLFGATEFRGYLFNVTLKSKKLRLKMKSHSAVKTIDFNVGIKIIKVVEFQFDNAITKLYS